MAKSKAKVDPASKRNFLLIGGAVALGALLTVGSLLMVSGDEKQATETKISGLQKGATADVATTGQEAPESPEYREAISDFNKTGAESASRQGGSFVPVLAAPPKDGAAFQTVSETRPGGGDQYRDVQPGINQAQQPEPRAPSPVSAEGGFGAQLQMLFERMSPGAVGTEHVYVAAKKPEAGVPASGGQAAPGQAAPAAASTKREIAGALEVYPMVLKTPIDTDTQDRVVGAIIGGKLRGADIYGGFSRRNEHVEVVFTTMRLHGKTYTINAVAMDPDNYRSVLSGDVDHKYMQRYGFPILSALVSAAAAAKADPGTNQTVSDGTVINAQPPRTNEQIAAAGLTAGANVVAQGLATDKVEIAVKVPTGTFGLMFLADVTDDKQ